VSPWPKKRPTPCGTGRWTSSSLPKALFRPQSIQSRSRVAVQQSPDLVVDCEPGDPEKYWMRPSPASFICQEGFNVSFACAGYVRILAVQTLETRTHRRDCMARRRRWRSPSDGAMNGMSPFTTRYVRLDLVLPCNFRQWNRVTIQASKPEHKRQDRTAYTGTLHVPERCNAQVRFTAPRKSQRGVSRLAVW
jgi:hypothetical protein